MRLTPIEIAAYVAAFRGGDKLGATFAVTSLGRIPWPKYDGPFPIGSEVIVAHDEAIAARDRLVAEMFAAVQAENERQAKDGAP